jgi:hypothetical protein
LLEEVDEDRDDEDYVPSDSDDDDDDDDYDDDDEGNDDDAEAEDQEIYDDIVKNLPDDSTLARKRVLKTTSGTYQRKRNNNGRNLREKSASDRKNQFPKAPFKVDGHDLICISCKTKLSLKYSTIKAHLESKGHTSSIKLEDKNQQRLITYAAAIKKRENGLSTAGSTVPLDQLAYRMKVTYALLRTGTPFSVLDYNNHVRELFEDLHCKVPKDSCTSYIPILNDIEEKKTH